MRGRVVVVVLVFVAAVLAFGASSASAVVTASAITTPASGHIADNGPNNTTTVAISGTATQSGGTGNVDILCYDGSHPAYDFHEAATNGAFNVAVSGGHFNTTLTGFLAYGSCTLRAVPAAPTARPTDVSMFAGPQVSFDRNVPMTVTGGPNNGALYDFYINNQPSQASQELLSVASCAVCGGRLFDPTNFFNSRFLWDGNAALYDDERLASNDRGYAQIDGHNVLFSYSAGIDNPNGSGFPTLTMSSSFAPNGDVMISEDEDAVRCPTDALPYGTGGGQNPCTPGFLATGVHLHRTMFQTLAGVVVQVVDVWTNKDPVAHNVNFDYDQYTAFSNGGSPPAYSSSYQFPWVSSAFAMHALGDKIAAPPSQPASMFIKSNAAAADGDTYYPQGAITFDPAPNGFTFNYAGAPNQDFVANYQRQIPAGGSLTIKQTFSMGSTQAGVAALATQAEDQQDVPVVTIGAPANGAAVSMPTVTVTGTATDRVISSLTVNGHAVAVGAGGAFSTPVSLNVGANTITATATDGAGNQGSATARVTYTPPKLMLVGSPAPSSTGVAFSIDCVAAAGATCAGGATMTSLEKLLGKQITGVAARKKKRSSKRVLVGSMSFSLAAGKTQKLFVPLNSTGRKLLARFKRLPVTLTIKLSANPSSVVTTKTTIKPKKKKKKKH